MQYTNADGEPDGFISKKLCARSDLRVDVPVKPAVDDHRRSCDGCKRDDQRLRGLR